MIKDIENNRTPLGVTDRRTFYFDADGVLAQYLTTAYAWWLEPNIFRELPRQENIINAVKELIKQGEEVFILTAYHKSTPQVKEDKLYWFNKYLPEIDEKHIIFTFCGENKADYIPTGITKNDILLDDFNPNLIQWSEKSNGTAIKVLNGINSKSSWNGLSVHKDDTPETIIKTILNATKTTCFK